MNSLTQPELNKINRRIDEINDLLDMCGTNDDDVADNLCFELDQLIERLEFSHRRARIRESGLQVVHS